MKEDFYTKTWFICLMFALWFLLIPLIVGLVLLLMQWMEQKKLTETYGEIDKLHYKIADLSAKAELEQSNLQNKMSAYADELNDIVDEISKQKSELSNVIDETLAYAYDFTDYDGISSEECKNKLGVLKLREQEGIKSGELVTITSTRPKKDINNNVKQMLRCFNAECDNALLNLTVRSIDTQRNKVQKSFGTINKLFETDGVSLDIKCLEIKLEMLNLSYTYELKKEEERAQQKAIREQMVEEERVLREIEREKQKIEKEEAQFKGELAKLIGYMQKTDSDVEKNIYVDKIKELEEKLKSLEKGKENVFEREQNTRAGFVYVISNIGSFGEGIYKIGMTRRLEPMDRINELSSASVPFNFDVHAMIFSHDAPALETTLHQHFRNYEVNKVNQRKEFFKVDLKEIERVVKENHNVTVEFTLLAKASEYRASMEFIRSANPSVLP